MVKSIFKLLVFFGIIYPIYSQITSADEHFQTSSSTFRYDFFLGGNSTDPVTIFFTPSEQGLKLENFDGEITDTLLFTQLDSPILNKHLGLDEMLFFFINLGHSNLEDLFLERISKTVGDISLLFPNESVIKTNSLQEIYSTFDKLIQVAKVNKSENHIEWFISLGFVEGIESGTLTLISTGFFDPKAQRDSNAPPYLQNGIVESNIFRSTHQTQQFLQVYDYLYELATRLDSRSND